MVNASSQVNGQDMNKSQGQPVVNVSNPVNVENMNKSQTESLVNISNLENGKDMNNSQAESIANVSSVDNGKNLEKNQTEANIKLSTSVDNSTIDTGSSGATHAQNGTSSGRRLLQTDDSRSNEEGHNDSTDNASSKVQAATVENEQGLEEDADRSFELFRDSDELADEYNYDYDDYADESMWGDEEWTEEKHEKEEDFVNVDSHILCTPVSLNL